MSDTPQLTELESKKLADAVARFQDLVFSLADSLLCDESLAEQTVEDVFAALARSSEVFALCDVASAEFEREVHRITYDLALARLVSKHVKLTPQ